MSRIPQLRPASSVQTAELERRVTDLENRTRAMPGRVTNNGSANTASVINQTTHGFAAGDVIRYTAGAWAKSKADTAANAVVGGIVLSVLSPDVFVLATGGRVAGLSSLTAGSVHYLSAATAGAITTTAPTIAIPILLADSTTTGVLLSLGQVGGLVPGGSLQATYTASSTFTIPSTIDTFVAVLIGKGGDGGTSDGPTNMTRWVSVTNGGTTNQQLSGRAYGGSGGGGSAIIVEYDAQKMRAASITSAAFTISSGQAITSVGISGGSLVAQPGGNGSNGVMTATSITPGIAGIGGLATITGTALSYLRSIIAIPGENGQCGPSGIDIVSAVYTPSGGFPGWADDALVTTTGSNYKLGYGFGAIAGGTAVGAAVLIYHR